MEKSEIEELQSYANSSSLPHELSTRIHEIITELQDLNATFDLMWDANQRAIKMWQKAHPGNDNVWPDQAKMIFWLLEERQKKAEGEVYWLRRAREAEEKLEKPSVMENHFREELRIANAHLVSARQQFAKLQEK